MKSETCVQSTNDFSTLSKVSAASAGYFTDDFQKHFVSRTCRRSPLINRGYCVRAQAITHCVNEFLQDAAEAPHRQVLSLGCGFDSLYFRVCGRMGIQRSTSIWEVDFPAVVHRKRLMVDQSQALKSLLKNMTSPTGFDEKDAVVLDSQDYRLIGADLSDVVALDSALEGSGIRWDCPTLILAEVVLCYMDPARSGNVIGWAGQRFLQSRFVVYEQFFPDDAFGRVMVDHFDSLNSPLRSVSVYPQLWDQEQRFLQKGWQRCRVLDMNQFSASCVSESEKLRIESLEPFDEFEELHLKCSHYFILVASQGDLADIPALRPVAEIADFTVLPPPASRGAVLARLLSPAIRGLRRFGHRSCLVSPQSVLSTGGFGEGNGKHQRLRDLHLLLQEQDTWSREVTTSQWDGRLLHSLTPLTSGGLLVLGGRFSPYRPAAEAQMLTYDNVTGQVTITLRNLHLELRRWRHTATEVSLYGRFYVFVFGGRCLESPALQEAMFIHTEDMTMAQVPVEGVAPLGCHSHSSCGWKGGAVLSGGILTSGVPTGSITILKPAGSHFSWEHLDTTPPLMPRYSHSSHVIGEKLLLVGGVWIHARGVPGLTIVDLITGQVSEYRIDSTSLEWPLMLHGHSSVLLADKKHLLLLGGGGTCFSFGTHLNRQPVVLKLPCC
ncbi:tRNA wybutosine-synthesizing protein 4 [Bufo gargarizans]|uniref:tRNA wybutosine-synthesizing protein 4 n=1 Tax=Bufo gargarizans TaxID=30331 RepID=UPI001CF28F98|nr:tRNA wybutosine-synthesizing protein 4 [Bufo gargarizans]XP_044142529.1 tRNA wybutosine-synthesizing protein 4 [Bufo gargarizans]XP_044142530.1 tRNA wybutosine-synthesizing protein 4 [Bufo gargarizans]